MTSRASSSVLYHAWFVGTQYAAYTGASFGSWLGSVAGDHWNILGFVRSSTLMYDRALFGTVPFAFATTHE